MGEHPLLDDNDDSVGFYGKSAVVGGDGSLAADTFLGDNGRKLRHQQSALKALEMANRELKLE